MEQPHFLLIPYSEQGHINPMLCLASQLAALGCKVTFVKAERQAAEQVDTRQTSDAGASCEASYANSQEAKLDDSNSAPPQTASLANNIQFVTVPAPKNTVPGSSLEEQDVVTKIVEDSMASSHPIYCVICDFMLWRWVRHVANAYGLRSALLSACSGLGFFIGYLSYKSKELEIEDLFVSSFGMPSPKDVAAYYGLTTMRETPQLKLQKHKVGLSLFEGIEDAGPILVNSFEVLEAPLVPLLEASGLDVRFIGPCLPGGWNGDDIILGSNMTQQAGSIFREEEACLPWLDLQEKGSVLFVSFGSHGNVETKQVEEIAMGIEKSGYKFLWVLRSDSPSGHGPTQFYREQSSKHEKGFFVSWAPQRKVLQHPSIGGFLTHSGWNSTLESVTFGVPMLCLPLLVDQPVNANFVHTHLQVGIRLTINQDGFVNKEEVANGLKALKQGQFSHRVSKFRQAAQLAFQESHHTLASFVQAMK